MTEQISRYVVLTGPPGCGKTTLVQKVCNMLKQKNYTLSGFITEEVRTGRERSGFDVVLLNGNRTPLARIKSDSSTGPYVGKYSVDVKSLEAFVLPLLNTYDKNAILVLDEIGKMELCSKKFEEAVVKCINNKKSIILATVPVKTVKPIPVVEMMKSHPEAILLNVDRKNRNDLVEKIVTLITDAMGNKTV